MHEYSFLFFILDLYHQSSVGDAPIYFTFMDQKEGKLIFLVVFPSVVQLYH